MPVELLAAQHESECRYELLFGQRERRRSNLPWNVGLASRRGLAVKHSMTVTQKATAWCGWDPVDDGRAGSTAKRAPTLRSATRPASCLQSIDVLGLLGGTPDTSGTTTVRIRDSWFHSLRTCTKR